MSRQVCPIIQSTSTFLSVSFTGALCLLRRWCRTDYLAVHNAQSETPTDRYKRIPALQQQDDLRQTLSSCVLWVSTHSERPEMYLSYKLFDRWIHKLVAIPVDNWRRKYDDDDEFVVVCYGAVSPRHFRLIDRVISYLIPQLKKLTIDITWHPALHNPKLQVSNLNAVTIHSTEQGVEFVCSDRSSARIDVNVKEAFLQLVYERTNACHCLNRKVINISGLSEAISILKSGIAQGTTRGGRLSPRSESFILEVLQKLDVAVDTTENVWPAILHSRRELAADGALGYRDPTKNHHHGLFQKIERVCKALIDDEKDLASKAIVLYICRALHQYGLQCRPVLVLISTLVEDAHFRKIAIEHFDLGQTCAKLLLVRSKFANGDNPSMKSLMSGESSSRDLRMQVPPAYIVTEQLRLPEIATVGWRVPSLPYRRNPPEQSMAQISILKNLLSLSPFNNHGVEFRSGQLLAMLLTFIERGLAVQLQELSIVDDCWFYVLRLVLANIHEYTFLHPIQATITNVPYFLAYKADVELKPIEGFIKQVLEMIASDQTRHPSMTAGFQILTDLVTTTPAAIISGLTAVHLSHYFPSIRLPLLSTEIGSGKKSPMHLSVFNLLETLLNKTTRFPPELLNQLTKTCLIGSMFQAIDYILEMREMERIPEEEAELWIQKCWELLTALVRVCRSSQEYPAEVLLTMEEQFAQELIDPFGFSISDGVSTLYSLQFLRVYLDAPQCHLYDQVHVFLRLVRWIRETLNRAWDQDEWEIVIAALDVVAVVCGHVTEGSFSIVQSFLDGLMMTLRWIQTPTDSEEQDRTVRVVATVQSKAGTSGLPPIPRRRSSSRRSPEIQPEGLEESSREGETALRRSRRSVLQEAALRSFAVDVTPHPASEIDTMAKLEHFRSRFQQPMNETASVKGLVIPPLDLAALTMVRDWHHGRKSVASTVYSSEYPVRPLSQISDRSGLVSVPDGPRLSTNNDWRNWSPAIDAFIFESDLYSLPDKEIVANDDDIPAPRSNPEVKYFDHRERSSSNTSGDLVSSLDLSSRPSFVVQPSTNQTTVALEKRAYSTSEVDEMAFASESRPSLSTEQTVQLNKVHSFDRQRAKPSLSMLQLIGDLDATDSDLCPTPHLWSRRSLPNINFNANLSRRNSLQSDDTSRGDPPGSAITIYAGSHSTEAKELEIDYEQEDTDNAETTTTTAAAAVTDSQALLLAKYQLTACDSILDHFSVHTAVLKIFLRFLAAEYHNKSKEKALTKAVSLGLHKHFHSVPRCMLLNLKDWAIQQIGNRSYILLKMLAKQLFNENRYPSIRRIGRGVFSSIHECSCPVLGGPSTCCVKVIDLPKDPYGMRSIQELLTEIVVLRHVQQISNTIRLYDFGTSEDNLYIVTKLYPMDLLTWRRQIYNPCAKMLFKIFAEIVKSVDILHNTGVVHFDLKCSNILLEPREDQTDLYTWGKECGELPFNVILADFGEAMFMDKASEGLQRSHGTQVCMSPEMLVSGSAGKRVAPGPQSDIWSLGCLFFELITGEVLFDDSDYSEFHTRLTTNNRTLLDSTRVEWIPETMRESVLSCLSYLLVRNPKMRVPLNAVVEWLEHLLMLNVLPENGNVLSTTESGVMSSGFDSYSLENAPSFLPESMDLEIRKDVLPLSARVSIMRFSLATDPWSFAENQITHVVYVHLSQRSSIANDKDRQLIRNATLRANGLLFEVQIPPSQEYTSRMSHCQKCCESVQLSCQSSMIYRIAIVGGKHTGQYLRLIARYLTIQQHKLQTINLDEPLLK